MKTRRHARFGQVLSELVGARHRPALARRGRAPPCAGAAAAWAPRRPPARMSALRTKLLVANSLSIALARRGVKSHLHDHRLPPEHLRTYRRCLFTTRATSAPHAMTRTP